MKGVWSRNLSPVETEVIAEIRAMRRSIADPLTGNLVEDHARIVHHILLHWHGNTQLRISTLAREIGIEMRTLERAFMTKFLKTVARCQVDIRLEHSRSLLSVFPPIKISAIAAQLGYSRVQDFNRFFTKHTGHSPAEWGRRERERIGREPMLTKRK